MLIRRSRSRTADGEQRLFDRLENGAAERIAKAQAKRQRKAIKRLTAGRAELNAYEVDNMMRDAGA